MSLQTEFLRGLKMFDAHIDWKARDAQLTTEPIESCNHDAPSRRALVERFYGDKKLRDEQIEEAFGAFYENSAADELIVVLKSIGASMADGGEQVDATTIGNRVIDTVRRELKKRAIEYANDNYEG